MNGRKLRAAPRALVADGKFVAKVARKTYQDDKTREQVATELDCSVATVARALQVAKREGIVRHVIDEDSMALNEDRNLASKLRNKFNLTHAIVVLNERVTGTDGNSETKHSNEITLDTNYDPSQDDNLHYNLGQALAEYLRVFVRPHDHIATVGGRGTYFVARFLGPEPLRLKGVSVSAISGRMATQMHDPHVTFSESSVDADDSAFHLAKALCDNFDNFHPLNRNVVEPGYQTSDVKNADFSSLFRVNNAGTQHLTPDILLCGIGRLGGKHMFMRRGDRRLERLEEDMQILIGQLDDEAEMIGDEFKFHAVGDVANRLFLIKDIPNRLVVEKQLGKINKEIVGLTFSELARIPQVIANAGGDHKYHAIRTVLRFCRPSGERFVNILCTDSRTAHRLMNENAEADLHMNELPGES